MSSSLRAPVRLKTEYQVNPIGLTERVPRFSWLIADDRPGAVQSAYHIQVGSEPGGHDLWDSGKVVSDVTNFIEYKGQPLASRQRAYWQVKSYDAAGAESPWSQAATFELGLIGNSEYSASWISATWAGGPQTSAPVPYFRKAFQVNKPIAKARLYITALGLYDVQINGQAVSADVFAPGWTDYSKRVYVQTHDVTSLIQQGGNGIGVILGDGWYSGHMAWKSRQMWGERPKLLAQLEITCTDGSRQTLVTDGSWKVATGAILNSEFLMGEQVDARRDLGDYSTFDYDDTSWGPVQLAQVPQIVLEASPSTMIRRINELAPINIHKVGNRYVVDFGQNMVGWVRLKLSAQAGHTVTMRFAEMLTEGDTGDLYLANMRAARNCDVYTTGGSTPQQPEIFEPRFSFRGFRYAEVENYPGELKPEDIRGIVIHTPMESASTFECSEPLLNQLHHNIIWGHKGNFLDVPTDCPQRDERLGWTGDAQVFIRTATLNFDVNAFFAKWIVDLMDSQHVDGSIPCVAPDREFCPTPDGGPAWGDAAIICPWTIQLAYGDRRVLERAYPGMQKFMTFMGEVNSINDIRCHPDLKQHSYGDWLSMDAPPGSRFGGTPNDLIGTAYYAYTAKLLAQMADILGYSSDAEKYKATFKRVREAFINHYVTRDGLIINHTQTAYTLALHFGLLPDQLIPMALRELKANIRRQDNHLTTGFVGTPYLLFALSDHGEPGVAMDLLLQRTFPSWLYPVLNGATTIWERWDGWVRGKGFQTPSMNSFNHYAYGAVGHWMLSRLVGIDLDPQAPGGKKFVLRPTLLQNSPLDWAKGSTVTPNGELRLNWKRQGDQFKVEITVPANTSATLTLPGQEPKQLKAGQHEFICAGEKLNA